jgi:hypothetical protein
MTISDLTSLFPQPTSADLGFRQGKIVTFDAVTGENSVNVGGTIIENVSLLNITGATLLQPGDIVGLLRSRTQYFIMGRIAVPGHGEIGTQLSLAYTNSQIDLAALTTQDSWLDLPSSAGPIVQNVPIGNAGRAIVFSRAEIHSTSHGYMAFEISGATSRAPAFEDAASYHSHTGALAGIGAASLALVEDLTPGLHVFTSKYHTVGASSDFAFRSLVILPY